MTNIALQGRSGVVGRPPSAPQVYLCGSATVMGPKAPSLIVCVAFVVVDVVVCFAHRGLGGRGGANAWQRFIAGGKMGVSIGV